MAYMSQWIPGAESAENSKFAQSAMDQFNKVLDNKESDHNSQNIATASIASIYFNQKNFDKAEEWNRKMIALDPKSKTAYYTLGVIAWTKWVSVDLDGAAEDGDEAGRSRAAERQESQRRIKAEVGAGFGSRHQG